MTRPHVKSGLKRLSRVALALSVAAAVPVAAACGDDDDDEAAQAQPTTLSITASEAGGNAGRYSGPTSVKAGLTRINFRNSSKAPMEAQLVRVDGDRTREELLKVIDADDEEGRPIPAWLHATGGVGTIPPGSSSSSTQELRPGKYFVTDTGGDDEKRKATVSELTVEDGEGGGELPQTEARVVAEEYSFRASGLKPGRNTITFDNVGKELHHIIAAPFTPGATRDDLRKFLQEEGEGGGRPPLDFEKATATTVLDGKTKQVTELRLDRPGKYALLCFITDRRGGPPHVAKGMVTETTVR